jgi:TadE-like protein
MVTTMMLQLTLRRLARDTSGTNLIEAALITPLLLILTFGIVDFASMFATYVALENGASVATRYAITGNLMDDPNNAGSKLSREDSIKAAMRDATPSVTLPDADFTFSHLSPGSATWLSGAGGPNDVGKVTVQHTWTPLTPILAPFLTNGQLSVKVDSAMKNEAKFQ